VTPGRAKEAEGSRCPLGREREQRGHGDPSEEEEAEGSRCPLGRAKRAEGSR